MKFIIVFVALFAIAVAAPVADHVEIVKSESDVQPESFKFAVDTSDGTHHDAEGVLKDAGSDHEAIVVHGSYSFVADDGKTYTVSYTADENGFQPIGAHLPTGADGGPVVVYGKH